MWRLSLYVHSLHLFINEQTFSRQGLSRAAREVRDSLVAAFAKTLRDEDPKVCVRAALAASQSDFTEQPLQSNLTEQVDRPLARALLHPHPARRPWRRRCGCKGRAR